MKLNDMSISDIESKYGEQIKLAGYQGTSSFIDILRTEFVENSMYNLKNPSEDILFPYDSDESVLVKFLESKIKNIELAKKILETLEGRLFHGFYIGKFERYTEGLNLPKTCKTVTKEQILQEILKVFKLE